MENGGKDCFDVCKKQGRCDWCGMDGLCCRKDRIGNGCDGTFGGHNHQCVLKPGNLLSVDPRPNGLETRVIIKISTHPCYPKTLTAFHDIKQKKNLRKKSKMAQSKSYLFQNRQFSIQGVLALYDFWDLEKIVLSEICTSGYYIDNFH